MTPSREELARARMHAEIEKATGRRGPVAVSVTVEDTATGRVVRVDPGRPVASRKEGTK